MFTLNRRQSWRRLSIIYQCSVCQHCVLLWLSVTPLSITPLFLHLGVHTLKHTHAHCLFHIWLGYDQQGALGAVGSCFQSLHYSAFSSSWTCPSQCVSLACLNYSHQDHYWEHSPPHPLYNLYPHPAPPTLKSPSGQDRGLWGLRSAGTFSYEVVECLSYFLCTEMDHPC